MTDIPEDIWRKAMKIASVGKDLAVIRIGIMQALMEERERCIARALGEKLEDPQDDADSAYDAAIDHVVDAIRTP